MLEKLRDKSSLDIVMLYLGKASGALTGFIFIPIYSSLLGPENFGVVAIILSIQAFALMMDFGMSTYISTLFPANSSNKKILSNEMRKVELTIFSVYVFILLITSSIYFFSNLISSIGLISLCAIIYFLFLVLQNIYYVSFLSLQKYRTASLINIIGGISKAVISILAMIYIDASVEVFIFSFLLCTVLHMYITRKILDFTVPMGLVNFLNLDTKTIYETLIKGKEFLIFSLFGAAVIYLDKPLLAVFFDSSEIGIYYLAGAFCMMPISLLAGPITQFYKPKIISYHSEGDHVVLERLLFNFSLILVLTVGIISLFVFNFIGPIIDLWLGEQLIKSQVTNIIILLLPSVVIGSMGFVPYCLLLANKDYRFQSNLNIFLAIFTLGSLLYLGGYKNIIYVVLIYCLYHQTSSVASWGKVLSNSSLLKVSMKSILVFLFVFMFVLIFYICRFLA